MHGAATRDLHQPIVSSHCLPTAPNHGPVHHLVLGQVSLQYHRPTPVHINGSVKITPNKEVRGSSELPMSTLVPPPLLYRPIAMRQCAQASAVLEVMTPPT